MSNLYIAITSVDDDPTIEQRAVDALAAAGIEVYRAWIEPTPFQITDAMRQPDRDHLKGQRVKVTLHRWASKNQPTEGVYLGQGERGMSIAVEGGGRYVLSHHEVKSVELA